MTNPLYRMIGFILSRPCVYTHLEAIAMRDPDAPIMSPDGTTVYMHRGWLFNKIDANHKRKYPLLKFSIRIHKIMMPDLDRHKHDHPFNARTFIMRGGYDEERRIGTAPLILGGRVWAAGEVTEIFHRQAGDTSTLGFEKYHKITRLHDPKEGALTFFMFGDYLGSWGFMVDGHKVLRRDYEAMMGKVNVALDDIAADIEVPAETKQCNAMCTSGQWHCPCGAAWDNGDEPDWRCRPLPKE